MSNDVLIAIPLFLFMGYLVERAKLIDRLFHSLHLATARVPGALAVATIVTCSIFATATGIVGACVTLMGLLALPAMLKAGYNIKVAAGAITAGGCLGILIPPSVLLIVYGAVAGVSVVQLYAGRFPAGVHARRSLYRLRHRARETASPISCRRSRKASGVWNCRAFAQALAPKRAQRVQRALCARSWAAPMREWQSARRLGNCSSRCCRRCAIAAVLGCYLASRNGAGSRGEHGRD